MTSCKVIYISISPFVNKKSRRSLEDFLPFNMDLLNIPSSCIKNVPKGSRVCWKSFTAEPLNVSLLHFQAHSKGHPRWHRMLPIKHSKEPLGKDLEAHNCHSNATLRYISLLLVIRAPLESKPCNSHFSLSHQSGTSCHCH